MASEEGSVPRERLAALYETLLGLFSIDELLELCFYLDIDLLRIRHTEEERLFAWELVEHCDRTGRVDELVEFGRRYRPHPDWDALSQADGGEAPEATYHAELRGSGAIAQGPGAVAAGEGGVAVSGDVGGGIHVGSEEKDGREDQEGLPVHVHVGGVDIEGGVVAGDIVGSDKVFHLSESEATEEEPRIDAYQGDSEESVPKSVHRPRARYLQSTFATDHEHEILDANSPLAVDGGPYTLQILIGPGEGEVPWPDEVLQDAFDAEGTLRLPVRVTSDDVDIASLSEDDVLYLDRSGESSVVSYLVTPRAAGRARLNVDVFYRGNLLQRQHIEVAIVETVGQPVPPSARPVQERRITYTVARTLSQEALARWEQRVAHITVERDWERGRDGSYVLLFRRDGRDRFSHDSQQSDMSLAKLVPAARAVLARVGKAYYEHGNPEGETARPLLEHWLPQLAYQGARLYEAILYGAAMDPFADLPTSSIIQVSPIGQRATLPWGMVYDRRLSDQWVAGESGGKPVLSNPLCSAWLAGHNCFTGGCPSASDPRIVCPSGFWGYRYIIEQIPAGLDQGSRSQVRDLPQLIDNCSGTHFSMNGYADFTLWPREVAVYRTYTSSSSPSALPFKLSVNENRASFEKEMSQATQADGGPHMLYFYAHGGRNSVMGVFLQLGRSGSADYITLTTLRGLRLEEGALVTHPLVFLNACESGDYGPEDYGSFIARFCAAGACGLVGTECSVWQPTARTVAGRFFGRFLQGTTAGSALWSASHDLLSLYSPLGLAYSLFASGLTRLVCPAI